jgi:hypothetical protein
MDQIDLQEHELAKEDDFDAWWQKKSKEIVEAEFLNATTKVNIPKKNAVAKGDMEEFYKGLFSNMEEVEKARIRRSKDTGQSLLVDRMRVLQAEFESMASWKKESKVRETQATPLAALVSPRKKHPIKRCMKGFRAQTKKPPLLTVYSEMNRYNRFEKMAVEPVRPFYQPMHRSSKDNAMRFVDEFEAAKDQADFKRKIVPPPVWALKKSHFSRMSPLSKRLTTHDLHKMATVIPHHDGIVKKRFFHEDSDHEKELRNTRTIPPAEEIEMFKDKSKAHHVAESTALTRLYRTFSKEHGKVMNVVVQENLDHRIVSDLYMGAAPEESIKIFLKIMDVLERRLSNEGCGLRDLYDGLDTDNSNTVTRKELILGFRKFGIDMSEHEEAIVFHYFDPNEDNSVSRGEFEYVFFNRRQVASRVIQEERHQDEHAKQPGVKPIHAETMEDQHDQKEKTHTAPKRPSGKGKTQKGGKRPSPKVRQQAVTL